MSEKQTICQICRKKFLIQDLYPIDIIRSSLLKLIMNDHPDIKENGYICLPDLQHYQIERSRDLIEKEVGELSNIEEEVLESLEANDFITENVNEEYEESLTVGQQLADIISDFGGSWVFIIIFLTFIIGWMFLNTFILITDSYDPYPYILLNLILSCLAAIQAPIIMMSQNRRALKDRIEAENDYKINLKAELQIRHISSKIDQYNKHHWHRLIELQQSHLEMMQALVNLQSHMSDNKKPKKS